MPPLSSAVPKVCRSWCGVTCSGRPSPPRSPAAAVARFSALRSRKRWGGCRGRGTGTPPPGRVGVRDRALRATGMRIGELLDLELDCLVDFAGHGTWLRVPVGKLGTERMVPLGADALTVLDDWIAHRGRQRAIPHPRHGRPAEFLFLDRGTRPTAFRLRSALDRATAAAGLRGVDGGPLHVTPHQLRHTFGTALIKGGIGLPALMALMGHVTPDMTLRYAKLASPTIRTAYQAAMDKSAPGGRCPSSRSGRTGDPGPGRVAARRDAQDPPRARLLLPPPGRRRLPLRQHL